MLYAVDMPDLSRRLLLITYDMIICGMRTSEVELH